ncbi:MBL fold metallo-hydrolase [Streptomyces catenulae]|uniref:MBL fold metallo-hydrolase n=1 Tax=Streptomyces catenulae TaxID=66875 RepID=A0ABV2YWX2_9ACTN|nr:MBL fold metallo-hydrolase [Streptomyces catenulae]
MTQVTDHRGGVWSISVPLPGNPLGHTLVHLLETDRGPVLIDTGWDDPASWDALTAGITACGFAVADVHGVLLTHHHPDHHGLSAAVREASGAWIAMHEADADVVRRTREARPAVWRAQLAARLAAAGAPEEHLAPLRTARGGELPGGRAAVPDRHIAPGELVALSGRRLRAVWTPGHTPGHVCLHLEEAHLERAPGARGEGPGAGFGRLFSGDHLLPGISPHIGVYEGAGEAPGDPLGDYLGSLERVARLAPAEVLPAHQHPFADAAGRARELLAHHEARLAGLVRLLAEPLTLWQLTVAMEWNRPWERIPYASRNIAVAEAEAHLRRLTVLGRAAAVPGADPVTYRAV